MRLLFRTSLLLALIGITWLLAGPWLRHTWYAIQLAGMPAPVSTIVPVAGVSPRALADTWHGARSGGRKHEGIDIFARRGTPVRSATEGIVTQVGNNKLGGKVVWVMGPGRQYHYYAHLDAFGAVAEGMRIAPGHVLGFVGTTGNAAGTPPHLHYGIYGLNGAINPYPILRTPLQASAAAPAARN